VGSNYQVNVRDRVGKRPTCGSLRTLCLQPEDGGENIHRNIGRLVTNYAVLEPTNWC
jgi:hypothetical protein